MAKGLQRAAEASRTARDRRRSRCRCSRSSCRCSRRWRRLSRRSREATFTASVGGGAVSAAANGRKEITALTIKPEAVDPEDVEMLQGPRDLRGQRGAAAGGRRDEQPHEQLHQRSEHPRSGAISAEYSKGDATHRTASPVFYFWLRRSPAARSVLRRKMAESVRLTSSAMGNDHHTSSSRPVRESRYATGSSTQIWRQTGDDQTVERRAERLKDAARDDAEARERERQADDAQRGPADGQHLLRGEKRPSSVPGMISKSARPTHMMAMAVTAERRIVLRKRSGLPAP